MNVESVDVSIEPGMMTVNFDNLFNGNKLLGTYDRCVAPMRTR